MPPSSGFDPSFFDPLAELEDDHFWFRARNALVTWALARFFPTAASILEVGCGNGYVLAAMQQQAPRARTVGSDLFGEGLAHARRRLRHDAFCVADVSRLPFHQAFDVAGAFDVLEHLEHDEAALHQMWRALRPGGGLLLTVPQHEILWGPSDDFAHHVRRYSRRELVGKVEQAGFVVRFVTSFVSLLSPLLLVARLAQRRGRAIVDPRTEFVASSRHGAIPAAMMRIERALITAMGIQFPFGGSLLLVAEKAPSPDHSSSDFLDNTIE